MVTKNYFAEPHREGFLEVLEYKVYYREFGKGDDVLLVLHGGPGDPHEYLAPLAELASEDLRVIMYDQFGTGQTSKPEDGNLTRYTVEHFRKEVDLVREALGESKIHVYGHSWGGMLALEYAVNYSNRVENLILANTTADMVVHSEKVREKVEDLSDENVEILKEYEEQNQFFAPEYREIIEGLYDKHSNRMDETSDLLRYSRSRSNKTLYGLMWGPNEFHIPNSSRLSNWIIQDRLDEVSARTLVVAGAYDHFDPSLSKNIVDGINNAQLEILEESGHLPMWDNTEKHNELVASFLE